MPQVRHGVEAQRFFTERERVLLELLFQELNTLRQAAGLPPRTKAQLKARLEQILATERRGGN